MKILIVKTSSLGDILHCCPIISDIQQHVSNAEIHWACEKIYLPLVLNHPGIKNAIPISWRLWRKQPFHTETWKDIRSSYTLLRKVKYDIILDTQALVKSAIVTWFARGTRWGGNKSSVRERLATLAYDKKIDCPSKGLHLVEWYRTLSARVFNYSIEKSNLNYGFPPPKISHLMPVDFLKNPAGYISIIHGSQHNRKMWPISHWKLVIKELAEQRQPMVLLWGNSSEYAKSMILKEYAGDMAFVPTQPTSILELFAIIGNSRFIIGSDTGPAHLAAALGKPILMLFMTTNPRKSGPYTNTVHTYLGGINEATPTPYQVLQTIDSWKSLGL